MPWASVPTSAASAAFRRAPRWRPWTALTPRRANCLPTQQRPCTRARLAARVLTAPLRWLFLPSVARLSSSPSPRPRTRAANTHEPDAEGTTWRRRCRCRRWRHQPCSFFSATAVVNLAFSTPALWETHGLWRLLDHDNPQAIGNGVACARLATTGGQELAAGSLAEFLASTLQTVVATLAAQLRPGSAVLGGFSLLQSRATPSTVRVLVLYTAPAVFAALVPLFKCNVPLPATAPPLQHAAVAERARTTLASAVIPEPEPDDWRQLWEGVSVAAPVPPTASLPPFIGVVYLISAGQSTPRWLTEHDRAIVRGKIFSRALHAPAAEPRLPSPFSSSFSRWPPCSAPPGAAMSSSGEGDREPAAHARGRRDACGYCRHHAASR